ncbi:hypothetical protein LTR20_010307 [Exophiala xenobiotica]|nr:hypothetical protein LTR20_010307 [Exophiala xenobiotica]KAK5483755.1 hypothetical protein LTR26_006188 [Exophiala xenobiotica]KAK5495023.1 hypothetical protein LTR83_005419 [Exophiala xenobiotica]KAK5507566.1 hypothetical protein LTR21_008773 [Exophiala xenobiotica]KAK5519425.1 hypothetical protein LTR07_005333 [Exophiala xenobiotica]
MKRLSCISRQPRRRKTPRAKSSYPVGASVDDSAEQVQVQGEFTAEGFNRDQDAYDSHPHFNANQHMVFPQQITSSLGILGAVDDSQRLNIADGQLEQPNHLMANSADHALRQGIATDPFEPPSIRLGVLNQEPGLVQRSSRDYGRDPRAEGSPGYPGRSDLELIYEEDKTALVADWDHWAICRCLPPPTAAPEDRKKSSIMTLEQNFGRPGPWTSLPGNRRGAQFAPAERFVNVKLSEATREWLSVIAQRFMRVAMDVHGLTLDPPSPASPEVDEFGALGGFIRLPPSDSLHRYLETVLTNYEPFYPLVPARILEPNQLAGPQYGRGSNLLLFLMFAFGSMLDPAIKARRFSTALIEICRHSIHDVLEKDSGAPGSGLLFYCSLIFIIKSSFSGDKAHMNIAVAHRHMYLTLMRSAGHFRKPHRQTQPLIFEHEGLKRFWQSWLEKESASRLAYGWVMLETEISLFYDCRPILNTSELEAPLPSNESLWLASNAEEWRQNLCEEGSFDDWQVCLDAQPDHSLRSLFQLLMDNELDRLDFQPTILHMRLLLYPLHVLVAELSQLLDSGLVSMQSRWFSSPTMQSSSILRYEEIRLLLQAWRDVFDRSTGQGARFRAMRNATLTLFHLISLNLFTAFGKLERVAREGPEIFDSQTRTGSTLSWIRAPELAIVHCGQVFRLSREMDRDICPIWSAAAIYRATLILWSVSILNASSADGHNVINLRQRAGKELVIDEATLQDHDVQQYLRRGDAKPILTAEDGHRVSLHNSGELLRLGIDTVTRRCLPTSFSAGVRYKLEEMAKVWEVKHRSLVDQEPAM